MPNLRLPFDDIRDELERILLATGMVETKARQCATLFAENSRDGVASHGLNRFPAFVANIRSGLVDIQAEPERLHAFGAMEQWDGKRGIGPLNAQHAMAQAVALSENHGLGCVGLRNSNHWMRAGSYGLQAAAAGCIGMCWTNTTALMPSWGAVEKKIGNNPMVVCIPRHNGPVLLDMAMSQFSLGRLDVFRRQGQTLPVPGGHDQDGQLTTDPAAILNSERALPIGYWKGSGLALVLDMMTALISGGDATVDISQREAETGVSQVFVAIDVVSQWGNEALNDKVDAIIADFVSAAPAEVGSSVRYPGQAMLNTRRESIELGVPVDAAAWREIQAL